MNLKYLPWGTIAKYAGVAILSVAGTLGGVQTMKSASTSQTVTPVASAPCPACSPTLKCPALPTPKCDILVNGVKLK